MNNHKTHYLIEFMHSEFDHIDNNNFISCWHIEGDFDTLEKAIEAGYKEKKKMNFYSFYIVKDNDLNQFMFDSKIYDETGKYKADDQ